MNIHNKAKLIIAAHNDAKKLKEDCIKAGICETCGASLEVKLIKEHSFSHTETTVIRNGFFKPKTIVKTKRFNNALKIYCPNNHQEHIQTSRNWGRYSDTLNKDIKENLKEIPYHYDDDGYE